MMRKLQNIAKVSQMTTALKVFKEMTGFEFELGQALPSATHLNNRFFVRHPHPNTKPTFCQLLYCRESFTDLDLEKILNNFNCKQK